MMSAAAFQACYSDLRLIKGRKVLALVFEVPLEHSSSVLDILGGVPDPSKSVWCAIARLNKEGGEAAEGTRTVAHETPPRAVADNAPRGAKKSWHEMSPAQQAGILANDPMFIRFAGETSGRMVLTENDAAEFIRLSCVVGSRSEIAPGTAAAACWDKLVSRYRAWEKAPEVGAA